MGRETPLARPLVTTPETHGPRGIGYAELPPATMPLSRTVQPGPDHRGGAAAAGRTDARRAGAAHQRGPRRPPRARAAATAPPAGDHGRQLSIRRQHGAHHRMERELRTRSRRRSCSRRSAECGRMGASTRPTALGLDVTERAKLLPEHLAALGARARAARRSAAPPVRARPPPVRARPPVRDAADGRVEPRPALRLRRAPLLHGVPQPLRRLLRRVRPRPAGARRRPGPEPDPDRGRHGGRGAGRAADHRRDGHGLAPCLGPRAQRGRGRRGGHRPLLRAIHRTRRGAGGRRGRPRVVSQPRGAPVLARRHATWQAFAARHPLHPTWPRSV